MKDITWNMSDQTIVRRVEQDPAQQTFGAPQFEKVKPGGTLTFDAHIITELMKEGRYLKKATIFSNVPRGGTWEVICDEGKAIGGSGSAPSPLMYLAVGLGFCLMSHVEIVAEQLDLKLDSVRLEQKSSFSTTYNLGKIHPRDIFGVGEAQELHLLIESSEPEDRMTDFVDWCEQACMALQTVAKATPVVTELHLNGERVATTVNS